MNRTNVKGSIRSLFKRTKKTSKKKETNDLNSRLKLTTPDFQEKKCFKKPKKGEKLRAARLELWSYNKRKSCNTKYVKRKTTCERKGDKNSKLHVA